MTLSELKFIVAVAKEKISEERLISVLLVNPPSV